MTERLAEATTIVVGVLVALLLGSTWEWADDRLDESEYETRLLAEFENVRAELAADQEARAGILTRVAHLLDPDTPRRLHPDSVPVYLAAVVDFRFFTPSHPALDELIAGGKLDLLRSDTLRAALLGYLQERDRVAVVEERERRFVSEQVEPWLVGHVPVELHAEAEYPLSSAPAPLLALAEDPAFRTVLAIRWERTDLARRFATGLGYRIDDVIGLLEE